MRIIRIFLLVLCLLSSNQAQAEVTVTYYHTDALGSVIATTDEQGQLLWSQSYYPYGDKQELSATDDNELYYTGKPHDDDTGLSYFGARYYDPVVGRFMGVDPVSPLAAVEANVQMFNRYAYANNNPYKYVDPDGRSAVAFTGGVLYETYQFTQGNGFNGASILGALQDGYNGQGDGFASAAFEDVTTFIPVGVGIGVLAKISKIATKSGTGLIDDGANFAQKTFGEAFSKGGKFSGQTIDDVAGQLSRGSLKPSDVPIEFYTRKSGQTLIANTRSAQALTRAGIPRSQWHGVNIAGDSAALRRLAGQLKRNGLPKSGTPTVRPSGGN